jgi:heme-degrading monooxygenase HmoA
MNIYRVDKFAVPPEAREEFLGRVRTTHEFLRTLPGFIRGYVLEQSSGPGEFNIVTFVEWQSQQAVDNAVSAVAALHRRMNFNPRENVARLGIKADLGFYKEIEWSPASTSA